MNEAKILVSKLNKFCRRALEKAAALCVSQTHFSVELEHLLSVLCEKPSGDVKVVMSYYGCDEQLLGEQFAKALANLKRGNNATPALGANILVALRQGWMNSSLLLGASAVRSGGILLGLLDDEMLRAEVERIAPALLRLPSDRIRQDLSELLLKSQNTEEENTTVDEEGIKIPAAATPMLDQYTTDLTELARQGKIDPITGREEEIRQLIDILVRRRQNNPLLTGETGVGKTAIVEGLALKIAQEVVPPALVNVRIKALDVGLLEAGVGVKGEFESRLKGVMHEIKTSFEPIILFIDEAHTLIGAGAQAGQNDAANLLKPALARGELRTIAATTWAEYKKYFEKDAALARRFHVVKVEEPAEEKAIDMLRGLARHLEGHHGVRILDEAITESVRLSHRYLTGRRLPDKAVSVLDTACARVKIARSAPPASYDTLSQKLYALALEEAVLTREPDGESAHSDRLTILREERQKLQAEKDDLLAKWEKQHKQAAEIDALRSLVESYPVEHVYERHLLEKQERIFKQQHQEPLVPLFVDNHTVANVIADWTGIPVGKMLHNEIATVLSLQAVLQQRVVGQDMSLEVIAKRLKTYRAHLDAPGKPIGVFLLAGPSGVGKTETAFALSEVMNGSEKNLVVVNMSEYQEAHTVSTLRGAPPGYVGYGKGGVLTEAVRRNPYSVVLLDEIDKAHKDVLELFYQVFDKGIMEDGEGVNVDFKNTILILTTNLGDRLIQSSGNMELKEVQEKLHDLLLQRFAPAFLARLTLVPYRPLGPSDREVIVRMKLQSIKARFAQHYHAEVEIDKEAFAQIVAHSHSEHSGARTIDHYLTQFLLPELSETVLEAMAEGRTFAEVHISVGQGGIFQYTVR